MRLLRVKDWQFEDGLPSRKYAILSHTWYDKPGEEVYLRDIRDLHLLSDAQRDLLKARRGWSKVTSTVSQAMRDGLDYVWIDTCCIDQTNPTELTTSINSMFEWYAKAHVCYVYLEDLSSSVASIPIDFSKIRWTTRGWTLQELIAPSYVVFFDSAWQFLTTRADSAEALSQATNIDEKVLRRGPHNLSAYSIAKRMSWAAGRQTSRPEDRAYSLFGIFDITMPTHYGEGGKKAFTRLQEAIIRKSDDQSLFAWSMIPLTDLHDEHEKHEGLLLAPSPDCFQDRGHIVRNSSSVPTAYHMSNRGLDIDLPGYRTFDYWQKTKAQDHYRVLLDCRSIDNPFSVFLLHLKPSGSMEYCVDPTAPSRCSEVDWSEFRKQEKVERPPRRKIIIRREANMMQAPGSGSDVSCALRPQYAKLRLELLPSQRTIHQIRQTSRPLGTWIHTAYPRAFWDRELEYCQPVSREPVAVRLGAQLKVHHTDVLKKPRMYDVFVTLMYGPERRNAFTDVHGVDYSNERNYETIPGLRIDGWECDPTDDQTYVPDLLCDNAAIQTAVFGYKEDPLLHSLPLTKVFWLNNKLGVSVTLDEDDVLGERFWVARVKLIDCSTVYLYLWYTLLLPLIRVFAFVVFGWDLNNVLMADKFWSAFLAMNLRYSTASLINCLFIFRLLRTETLDYGLQNSLVFIGAPMLAAHLDERPSTRSYYQMWNTAPNALAGVSPLYSHMRESFGNSVMYRQWELMSFISYAFSFSQTTATYHKALIDILWYTVLRDGSIFIVQRRTLRALRMVTAWLLMKYFQNQEWQAWSKHHMYRLLCGVLILGGIWSIRKRLRFLQPFLQRLRMT